MKKNKIMIAATVFLCTFSAFAQTADSAQNLTGLPDRAPPRTQIGQDNAQGTSAAQITYESELDVCPSGFTGSNGERRRKVYIRPNGSRFEEPWYVATKAICRPIDDGRITDLQNQIRVLSDRLVAVENKPQPAGGASPVFTMRSGSVNGTTENGRISGYCVSAAYANWSNFIIKDIVVDSHPGRTDVGPWPNWPGRQVSPNMWVGPICPEGMGFTQLSYTPQAPTEGE